MITSRNRHQELKLMMHERIVCDHRAFTVDTCPAAAAAEPPGLVGSIILLVGRNSPGGTWPHRAAILCAGDQQVLWPSSDPILTATAEGGIIRPFDVAVTTTTVLCGRMAAVCWRLARAMTAGH